MQFENQKPYGKYFIVVSCILIKYGFECIIFMIVQIKIYTELQFI